MSYNVKCYPKPIGSNAKTNIESICLEFLVGLICAGAAVMSYDFVLVMFVPNAVLAVTLLIMTFYNIYQAIQDFF